jgi:ribosomal protein L13
MRLVKQRINLNWVLKQEIVMKTYSAKPSDIEKKWILIDAENLVVGRLAAIIATRLRGKHLPTFTPHMDVGDNVIVINADKVVFTGRKRDNKVYYRHTGYPAELKKPRQLKCWKANSLNALLNLRSNACCRAARWPASNWVICASMPVNNTRTKRNRLKNSTSRH